MKAGRTGSNISRLALTLSVVGSAALPIFLSQPQPAHAQTPSRLINGIAVSGRLLEVWSSQGSNERNVYVNGLPITERRSEISLEDGKAYETQWFERARYELHTENPSPHDVLLGRLGAWDTEGRGKLDPVTGKAASPADQPFVAVEMPPDLSRIKLWFPETRHTLSGKLLEYWNRYGGLSQFGFPLSEPFTETSQADGKPYTVQYFERARMELHPEKPEPYNVELGLLGVEQRHMTPIAGDSLPVAPPKGVTTSKEIVKIASSQEPRDLTFADNSSVSRRVRSFIEDGLVGRDDNENLFPLNAWYIPTLENGGARFIGEGDDRYLQVKYKLRQGIKWSDGRELTSNDAVFAYRLITHPDFPAPDKSEYERLRSMDNPDKHTVVYNYRSLSEARAYLNSRPNKSDYSYLQAFVDAKKPVFSRLYSEIGSILPEHALKDIPPGKIRDSSYARAPIGTGPWRVERWTIGQEIVLAPNEHYSLTAKPLIKRVEFKFIPPGCCEAQFKTGNLDLWSSESYVIPPADTAGIEAAGGRVVTRPAATWEHLDFSFRYLPFKETPVREAIFRAINRQRVIDVAYRGSAGMMNGVVPSGVYFSLEHPDFARNYPDIAAKYKLPIYEYNPARAAQLLDDAGWRCPVGTSGANCGGQTREKGGMKLAFEYATTINAVRQNIQGLVVADLKAVGVDAQQKAYPAAVFFAEPGPRSDGTTKLAQFSYVTTKESDFEAWTCPSGVYHPTFPLDCNIQYFDAGIEEWNNKFNTTSGNEMVEAAAEAQYIIMKEIAVIPLARRANIEVITDKLQNHKLPNGLTTSAWNARQWWFK